MLCFHLVKYTPFLSPPILHKDQIVAEILLKRNSLSYHHIAIPSSLGPVQERVSSGPLTPEVSPVEFTQMKEQMSELMRMVH